MQVDYDSLGNPVKKTYTNANGASRVLLTSEYDGSQKVVKTIDNEAGICYNYNYNGDGELTRIVEENATTGAQLCETQFNFDATNGTLLSSKTYGAVGQTYRPIYEKNSSGQVYPDHTMQGVALDGKYTDEITRDSLRRAATEKLTLAGASAPSFEREYSYLSYGAGEVFTETQMVSSLTNKVRTSSGSYASTTVDYTYDASGNIETVKRGTSLLCKYYYDGLNRLTREDNYELGKTYLWTYDQGGNITSKKEYFVTSASTPTGTYTGSDYTYATTGWKDRLLSYKGEQCVYDAIGNPTTYRNHNLEWTKVRRLAKYDNETFEYNAAGIRTKKNGITYTLDGNKILKQTDGATTLTFYYGVGGVI